MKDLVCCFHLVHACTQSIATIDLVLSTVINSMLAGVNLSPSDKNGVHTTFEKPK